MERELPEMMDRENERCKSGDMINKKKESPAPKKRGRKKVKESDRISNYKYQAKGMEMLRKYVMEPRLLEIFKKGELSVHLEEEKLRLEYIPPGGVARIGLAVPLKFENRRAWDECNEMVQDFLMECFYFYEWDGRPMRFTELGVIMGVSKQAVYKECRNIMDKVKEHETCGMKLEKLTRR